MLSLKRIQRRRKILVSLAVAGVLGGSVPQTFADTWSSTTSGTWNTATNWNAGAGPVPVSGTTTALSFNASGTDAYTATNDIGAFTLNSLAFDNTGTGLITLASSVAANTLILGGTAPTITKTGSGAATSTTGFVYSADTTITNSGTGLLTLGGQTTFATGTTTTFNGSGSVTLGPTTGAGFVFGSTVNIVNSGTGTVKLNDAGTYTGANVTLNLSNTGTGVLNIGNLTSGVSGTLNINAGTVAFAGATGGDLFGGALTLNVASGATFDFAANGEGFGALTGSGIVKSTVALSMALTGTRTWAGSIQGTAGSFSTGAANCNYTFTGTNTYTGATTVVANSILSLGNGGTSGSVAGNIANAGTLIFNRSDTAALYSGVISGAGTVNQQGTGKTTLSGTNTYTGATNIQAGTLAITNAAGIPATSLAVNVTGGAVLDVSGVAAGYTLGTGRTLTVGRTGTPAADVVGAMTISGTLNVGGVGTVSTASFNGNTAFSTGTTRFDLSNDPAGTNNDTVNVTGTLTFTGTNPVNVNATNGSLGAGNYVLFSSSGALSGSSSNFSLLGLSTTATRQIFTFDTTTQANKVLLNVSGTNSALTWVGNATANVWDLNTTANFSGGAAGDNKFYNNDSVTFDGTGVGGATAVTLTGSLVPAGVTVTGSQDYTFSGAGVIGGAFGITKSGTGKLTLSTANTYTGPTVITGGVVSIATTTAMGASSGVLLNGATLQITTAGSLNLGATQPLTIGALGGTLDVATGTTLVKTSDGILGSGTLTKTGGGTFSVQSSGTSVFTGAINVNDGSIQITSNRITAAGDTTINSGGSFWVLDTTTFTNTAPVVIGVGKSLILNGNGYLGNGAFRHTLDETGSATSGINIPITLASTARFNFSTTIGVGGGTRTGSDTLTDTFQQPISGPGGLIKDGNGTMIIGAASTYTGTTTVSNGTLKIGLANAISASSALQLGEATSSASGIFDLNGFSQTFTGLSTAGTGAAHAVVNTGGTAAVLTVNYSGASASTFNGVLGGVAGNNFSLVKSGTGSLSIAGASTFAGSVTVSGGSLRLGNNSVSRDYTVANGGSLTLVNASPTAPQTATTLSLGTGGATGLGLELIGGAAGASGALSITASNGLTANGTVNLSVASATTLSVGQFPLISYVGTIGGSGFSAFSAGTLTLPSRVLGTLVNNTGAKTIDLNVTGVDFLKWTGASGGNWDINTSSNWKLAGAGTATTYLESGPTGDTVVFDETATGPTTITLAGTVNPAAVTVSGPTNYTFSGTGKISGATGLTKTGAGTLTLATSNDYAGLTTISSGTLQIGSGSTTGSVGSAAIVNSGTLAISRSDDVTISNAISGTGGLSKLGTNAVTLTGAYTATGAISIAGGTLGFGNAGTIAGNISGAGALLKSGAGVLALTGTDTHTGGTTITGGTLQIGAGGTTGTLSGDVVNNGTLAFNRSDTTSYAGNVSGTGGLTHVAGTTTLSGNLTYAGVTTVTSGSLTFTGINTVNGAVSIPASSTLTIDTTAAETASAGTAQVYPGVFSGAGVLIKNGTGTLNLTAGNSFTGTLNVNKGLFLLSDPTLGAGTGGDLNCLTINVNNGGTFQFGAVTGENPDLPDSTYINVNTGGTIDWRIGENYGGVNLLGGTISMVGTITAVGTNMSWTNGTVTGTAALGGATAIDKTTTGTVTINGVALNNTGGLNIAEGTISTNAGITNSGLLTLGSATTSGTLQLTGTFPLALAKTMVINAGGGTIDVQGAAVLNSGASTGAGRLTKLGVGTLILTGNNAYTGGTTITAGVLQIGSGGTTGSITGDVINNGTLSFNRTDNVSFSGAISGTGAVDKQGSNTLTLSGPLTYSGTTNVGGGMLRVSPFAASTITLADGATLAVANPPTPGTLTATTVTLGTTGSTLRFELAGSTVPTAPLMNITATDGFVVGAGAHSISIGGLVPVGQFALVDYTGAAISSGFTLSQLPARTLGSLVYNTTNTSIDLLVTGSDSIKWDGGVSTAWDTGTAVNVGGTNNWKLVSNSSATNFVVNDAATFDDTATGSGTVDIAADVSPANVNVNNTTKSYTFQGAGAIAGAGDLVKQGSGNLTILNNNTYTGSTTISAGTVTVGNGGLTGTLGTGPVVNNGTLVFNRSDDVTLSSGLSGTGTLSKLGANTLTISGVYASSGNTSLAGGVLALNSSTDYIYSGVISGAGAVNLTGGAIIVLSGNNTFTGGTTIGGGTLTLGNGGTSGSVTGDIVDNSILAVNRSDGLTYAGAISGTGRYINVAGNNTFSGALTYAGSTTISGGTLTVTGNNALASSSAIAISPGAGLIIDTTASASNITIGKVVSGSGTLIKTGTNNLILTANNSFNGTLNINAGRVILSDPGAGTGTSGDISATTVNVNNGGSFQFGQGGVTSENPDLPTTTYFNINTGGVVEWRIGEQAGGVNLNGGTLTFNGGNYTSDGSTTQIWNSGTVNGTANSIGGLAAVDKLTSGTVTIAGSATVTSAMNIKEGTVAYATAANLGTNALTIGTATTVGTLEYQGATTSRSIAIGLNGAATIKVNTAATVLTQSGVLSGTGSLAKDGPGTLILTGVNTYAGTTTIAAGTLQIADPANIAGGTAGITLAGGTLKTSSVLTLPAGGPSATVTLAASTTSTVDTAGNNVIFNQPVVGSGNLVKAGAGSLKVNATNTNTGGISVTGGTLDASAGSIASATGTMNVSGAGSQLIAKKIVPSSLTVGAGATVTLTNIDTSVDQTGRSAVGAWDNSGLVDIGKTGIVIGTTVGTATEATILAQILAARGTGSTATWTGTTGITSSNAAANPGSRGIGYVVGTGQITVAQTVLGDANLDDIVNIDDLSILAQNYNLSGTNWQKGDYNFDGTVNIDDLSILAQNYNLTSSDTGAANASAFAADYATVFGGSPIPEPGSASLVALAGVGLLARRRRRSR